MKFQNILHELKNKFGEFKYKLNDNNEVVAINLSNRGVETKDLELIGRLTSLEKLDFSENKITKIQIYKKMNYNLFF